MKKSRALRALTLAVCLLALAPTWGCGDDGDSSPAGNNAATNNNPGNNNPANNNPANNNPANNNPANNNPNTVNNNPNTVNNNPNAVNNNPVCTDDANSPNHTPETATAVSLGASLSDLQICPGSDDWYAVELEAGVSIQAGIFFTSAEGDLDFYVYDASDTTAPVDGSEGVDDAEVIEFTAPATGTYYFQVVGFEGAANSYDMVLVQECNLDSECGDGLACVLSNAGGGFCSTFQAPACGQGDTGEPNDTSSTARSITLTGDAFTESGLAICEADIDIYEVVLTAPGTLTATVTPTGAADMDVYFVDAVSGDYVGAGITESTGPEVGVASYLPAGTYHVRVVLYEAEAADVTYALSITLDATGCEATAECADALGRPFCMDGACASIDGEGSVGLGGSCDSADDCSEAAAGCYDGSVTAEGWICTIICDADADCAALGAGAYCSTEIGACLTACTTDGQCTEEEYCGAEGRCESRECSLDADCAREGEVCVPGLFGEGGLCGVFTPTACDQAEASEPNDTDSQAAPVTLTDGAATVAGLSICDGDVDTFTVTLDAPTTLTASVAYAGPADLDVYILDATGNAVGAGTSVEETSESASAEFIAPGTYLIRVVAYPGEEATTESYTLTLNAEATSCATNADCESTSVLRLTCEAGACVDFDGAGQVALGGSCDTSDDCVEDAELCYNAAGSPAEGSNICTVTCGADEDCAAVEGTVCVAQGFFGFCLPE